ncbi:MAG: transposase zinc-binding domain-containing protein [Myxococcales bacterium]|nr:transposase zinc-binding domain-containing protein [Myxococcales bacterium]
MRKVLEGALDCGFLSRGFARLRCHGCVETRLVAFACKGAETASPCTRRPARGRDGRARSRGAPEVQPRASSAHRGNGSPAARRARRWRGDPPQLRSSPSGGRP